MGLDHEKRFHRYHRGLSRARWSSLEASRILLGPLLEAFVGQGRLIVGIDETLERRYGKKIAARASGPFHQPELREEPRPKMGLHDGIGGGSLGFSWVWALPFLSALDPSERYAASGVDGIRR